MTERHTVKDGRGDLPFMVHSELDDLDLSPFEFRVYAHMVRRANDQHGVYWESNEAGAKHCRMDVKTYRAALVTLVERGLVTRVDRKGQTSEYRLTPKSEWLMAPTESGRGTKSGRGTTSGTPAENGRGTPTKNGRTPLPETVDKGNPLKGVPGRESQKTYTREPKPKKPVKKKAEPTHEFDPATVDLPPQFDRERFTDFCATRLKAKSPMTVIALRRFINKHQHHDRSTLDQMFDNAIVGNWKDLYPLKDRDNALARRGGNTPEARAAESATDLLAHLERRKAS